ncbi:MAG: hypothetical protein CMF74_16355 [Maricaulis sp.]|nr:hypothetical protein [Maricaulis sp.]HAQ35996.1 hypothetical protein [Alphaproteobacteria bacterium]
MNRYTRIFLIIFAALLVGFAAFNALVDPFDVTGAPGIAGVNERRSRIYADGGRVHAADLMARGAAHSVLLGSSRTVDGFPRHPEDWPGGIANAGMRGTNIFELSQSMLLAARDPELRCIVIGLDLDEFGTHSKAKATYWLSALADGRRSWAFARIALSPNTFAAAVRTIVDNVTGSSPRVPWQDVYDPGAQRRRYESGITGIYRFYLGYDLDPDRLAYFRQALDAVTASGVQVTGFIHPVHAWREAALFEAGREEDYFRLRTALAELFAEQADRAASDACVEGGAAVLWDFSGFQDFAVQGAPAPNQTAPHALFYEPSHYLPHVGQEMLDRMRGEAGSDLFDPGRFGVRLTPEIAAETTAAIRERYADWRGSPDGREAASLIEDARASGAGPEAAPPVFLNRDDWADLHRAAARLPRRADAG